MRRLYKFKWKDESLIYNTMAFVNRYKPADPLRDHELYGPEPYDVNFIFPVSSTLSSDKVRLVSFVPRIHAAPYLDGVRGYESMYEHMPVALEHPRDFLCSVELFRRGAGNILFAIIDLTRPDPDHAEWGGSIAGMIGLLGTDKTHLVTEFDPVVVLPAFRRTHVGSHAVGVLLRYTLDVAPAGLGLRKVKWVASPHNIASNNLARRMGFKLEGVSRWNYTLPRVEGYPKVGKEGREGDTGNGLLGRDSNEYAICWDDWENGGRDIVEKAFARMK